MKTLLAWKWQLFAGMLLLAGLLLSRGGAASLIPLVRILVPIAIGLLLFKVLKKKLMASAGAMLRQRMEQMAGMSPQGSGAAAGGRGGKVVDMCPRCGSMLAPGHRCKK